MITNNSLSCKNSNRNSNSNSYSYSDKHGSNRNTGNNLKMVLDGSRHLKLVRHST